MLMNKVNIFTVCESLLEKIVRILSATCQNKTKVLGTAIIGKLY